MKRRTLLTTMASVPLLTACYYPQYFDIAWEEEVQLHDGRVIVVKLKYTYERLNRLYKYEKSILRNTEISFNAGKPHGVVSHLLKRQRPMLLDYFDSQWFFVLQGRATLSAIEGGQNWGIENGNGQYAAQLSGGTLKPIDVALLPKEMVSANILMDYAPIEELVKLDATRVTIEQKHQYLIKYPLDPIDARIERPTYPHHNSTKGK